MHNNQRLSNS